MNCEVEGCRSERKYAYGICPGHRRSRNFNNCQHPGCDKRTHKNLCQYHDPDSIARGREQRREARERQRDEVEWLEDEVKDLER